MVRHPIDETVVHMNSARTTYAGIENPLFFDSKTAMLFGDAKASIVGITHELNALRSRPHERPGESEMQGWPARRGMVASRRSMHDLPNLRILWRG